MFCFLVYLLKYTGIWNWVWPMILINFFQLNFWQQIYFCWESQNQWSRTCMKYAKKKPIRVYPLFHGDNTIFLGHLEKGQRNCQIPWKLNDGHGRVRFQWQRWYSFWVGYNGWKGAARMLYWHQQLQWQVQKTPQSIRLLENLYCRDFWLIPKWLKSSDKKTKF